MGETLREALDREALAVGFHDIAVLNVDDAVDQRGRLAAWLGAGYHGEMTWMAERTQWRADPRALWPEARSVIMLAESYAPDADPLEVLEHQDRAAISVYAKGKDYHDVVKKRLKRLGRWLIDQAGGEIKVFVDTAPVMEKPLAQSAGLGWQGKHTNLVSRRLGSWFFLGALFTTLEIRADNGHVDRCGGCRQCLDVCPTAAFPAPYQLDARRCISYLTIELKGPIPREMRPLIGNRIYGCDDCLAVCPWNKFAQAGHAAYETRAETDAPALVELLDLSDTAFRERFRGSPIKRIGRARFLRNVLVALGNATDQSVSERVAACLTDETPLVRGAAIWALSRLLPTSRLATFRPDLPDPDADVEAEWEAALSAVR